MAQNIPARTKWTPPPARIEGDRLLKARAAEQRVRNAAVQAETQKERTKEILGQELGTKVEKLEDTVDRLIDNLPRIIPNGGGGGRKTVKYVLERDYADLVDLSATALRKENNLSDVVDADQAAENLGLGWGVPDSNGSSWTDLKAPAVIRRSQLKFLMPEHYIGLETQVIYCGAGNPSDYTGATNFKPAFDAMREEMLSLRLESEWPPSPSAFDLRRAPFGVALQPGHRYAVDGGVNFTKMRQEGFVFEGNGGTLVARYANGAPVLDLIGSSGWTVNALRIESDSAAQPSFACLVGRPEVTWQAADMQFRDCYFDGWFAQAGMGNFAAEVFGWQGGQIINYNAKPGFWLDSTNTIDVAAYTQCSGVSLPSAGSANASCIMHTFDRTSIRAIQDTPLGAFRITSSGSPTQDNSVRKVRLNNVYLTNNGSNADTLKPGVHITGVVNDFYADIHGELKEDNSEIELSHLVYYNTTAEQIQNGHTIIEHLADAEVSVIGKADNANMLYLMDADIRVYRSRGKNAALVDAKLFGDNMATQAVVSGQIHVGADADLLDMTKLVRFTGDIYAPTGVNNVSMPSNSRARLISGVMEYGGVSYLSQKSVTANGAFDAEDADVVRISGSVTAVSLDSAFRRSELKLLNVTTNFVVLSGLAGPNAIIPPSMSINLLRDGNSIYSSTVGTYVGVYAPTLTAVTNVDSVALADTDVRFTLVGTHVRVSGRVIIDATVAGGTASSFRVSLPISSNLADGSDLSGQLVNAAGMLVGQITADTANNVALVTFPAGSTGAVGYSFDFEYQIK